VDYGPEKVQWSLLVQVLHGPKFGHRISLQEQTTGRGPWEQSLGSWKGIGIPDTVLSLAGARIISVFDEHLTTRYGIANELPLTWPGGPEIP
jgi:hypothetical protein